MNIFNFLPKRIDLTKYYDSLPEELIENIFLDRDEKYGYLRLSTTNDQEHFRLSYTVYGCEGGASGYFPLSEEDIYEGSKGKFVSVFNGGFIGDDVEELDRLYRMDWNYTDMKETLETFEDRIQRYNSLPWYKRIFKRI